MSGPIVRKYGFPNFEKIFGERALEHGTDEEAPVEPAEKNQKASEATAHDTEGKTPVTSPPNPPRSS
jgi:hypothetical protein